MTISKRELLLSQDLMDLQARYNTIVRDVDALKCLVIIKDGDILYANKIINLLETARQELEESRREPQLSADLVDLQARYNAIYDENKFLRQSCLTLRATSVEATKRIEDLLASISVLKNSQKKVASPVAKKKSIKNI